MLEIQLYEGPFSFVTSQLHSDCKVILPDYDQHNPKTWPYVTLAAVENHGPYWGYPDLPAGVAYERSIMKRYESMYSAADRKHIASVNGSFHKRYPCNYDQHDKPKKLVGMSEPEYDKYMATITKATPEKTPASELHRRQPKSRTDSERHKSHNARRCANKKCLEARREAARLRGELFDRESQLFSLQQHVKEFETCGRYRRNATSHAEFELERQRQRAEAAERECRLRKGKNTRMSLRIEELERRVDHGGNSCTPQ